MYVYRTLKGEQLHITLYVTTTTTTHWMQLGTTIHYQRDQLIQVLLQCQQRGHVCVCVCVCVCDIVVGNHDSTDIAMAWKI